MDLPNKSQRLIVGGFVLLFLIIVIVAATAGGGGGGGGGGKAFSSEWKNCDSASLSDADVATQPRGFPKAVTGGRTTQLPRSSSVTTLVVIL
jgi:hypothetical protein